MDYKDLIDKVRKVKDGLLEDNTPKCAAICEYAADAIETLLAERDAAVEDLRGLCWCCSHGKKYENGQSWSKATTCEHMRELGVVARIGGKCKCKFWEWRGPVKGESNGSQ